MHYHSNETRAPITNPTNNAQLESIPYHSSKLHPGPYSSVEMRRWTDRQTAPRFSAHVYCGQTARCIRIPLGTAVGLRLGYIALDGTQVLPKRGTALSPIFGPYPLWPNSWVDEDATWYGGRPRPRRHCVRWGPSSPKKGHPQFSAHVYCGQTAG